MRKFQLSVILLLIASGLIAQKNGTLKGIAFDTLSKQPVGLATVTIMEKKDSSLVSFGMTDNEGRFDFKGLANGEYRILITHVNYRNSNTFFKISDQEKNVSLGNIVMNDKNKVLQEAVVTNEAPPVTIINDTVQYNAGSFKTAPNASVEQLLKRLPGVKVEKDGTIKAQGEKVSRVLVDGKEFFGNDPKVATKNLPADAIDKVQVYDKQSDQAQLTGFEDGNYEKTINLKLKKDKKKGVFGKITAGGGTRDRFESRASVNSFKGARQMSVIGLGNNDNAEGFSFMDILNFTGALNQLKSGMSGGGGNVSININSNDPNAGLLGMAGGGGNNGIKTIWGGGLNYNNIIGKKNDWQSNYFYNRYNPNTESHIQRQYPSGNLYNQNTFADNLNSSHRFNINDLYQIDSSTSLRINPSLTLQETNNVSNSDYATYLPNGVKINDGSGNNSSSSEGYNFQNTLLFRKKMARRGRTFSLSLQTSLNNSTGHGGNSSITGFYNPNGSLNRRDTLNQKNNTDNDLKGYNAKVVYTEPLFRRSLMEFSVGRSDSKNASQKTTMDYNKVSGKFDKPNQLLTSDYSNTYSYTTAGLRVRTQKKKYNYMVGAVWQAAELAGTIVSGVKDSVINKTFHNVLPNARFQYNFSKFKSISINYNTFTTQPTMTQLQPVPDVTNPLNVREGNPDLKQEFTHAVQGNLNLLNPFKNRNLFVFFNIQGTQNKIVNHDSLNSFGVRYTKPVNVSGVLNMSTSINVGLPARFVKGSFNLGSSINYYRGKQFVNTTNSPVLTNVKTFSWGPDLGLDMNPNDKISISVSARINYNRSSYSAAPNLNTSYFSQEYEGDLDWQLPKNFFFSTDFTYTINNQLSNGFNTNVPIWNASISKQMLHYNRGELKLRVSDLLDRNTGINRSVNQGYIEDSRVKTLRRFFMLSFTYSLSKTGLNNAGPGGGGFKMIAH